MGHAGDVSSEETARTLIEQHPSIDILVNNAGIFEPAQPSGSMAES